MATLKNTDAAEFMDKNNGVLFIKLFRNYPQWEKICR